VVDDPDMGVERGAGPQCDQITALLGVDQEHPLPRRQDASVLVDPHLAQRPDDLAEVGLLVLTNNRSPGLSSVR